MHSVLLIWVLLPEELKLYELDLDDTDFAMIQKCHNRYINCGYEKGYEAALEWLNTLTESTVPIFEDKKEVSGPVVPKKVYDAIVVSGFLL